MTRLVLLGCILMVPARTSALQAPPTADLWRVAAATQTTPPALASGPVGAMWNAAAPAAPFAISLEVLQTSDAVGLSGFAAGLSHGGAVWTAGVVLGRMQVRDLVRTTTSPNSELGGIPVYEQFLGTKLGVTRGPIDAGALLAVHDERFDLLGGQGITFDVGMRYAPLSTLRVAAATHFFPVDFTSRHTTDYYVGVEYEPLAASPSGSPTRLLARYGATFRSTGPSDHMVSAGISVGGVFDFDVSVTRQAAYNTVAWQPAVSIALQIGRYHISAARGSGVNDIGGSYRLGMHVVLQ